MSEINLNRVRLIVASIVLALFCVGAFAQQIESVVVVPSNPTTSDDVSVHVYGWLWSSDVYIASIAVVPGSYSFHIDIYTQAGGIGLPVLVPFDTIVPLGMLSAYPSWTVTANGYSSGGLQDSATTQFPVVEPTGVNYGFETIKPKNYPNPFADRTTFRFTIDKREFVDLIVFDILGAERARVVSKMLPAGEYNLPLDTRDFSPGKYFYQLRIGSKLYTEYMLRSAK